MMYKKGRCVLTWLTGWKTVQRFRCSARSDRPPDWVYSPGEQTRNPSKKVNYHQSPCTPKVLLQFNINNSLKPIFHVLVWINTNTFMGWDSRTEQQHHVRTKNTNTNKLKESFQGVSNLHPSQREDTVEFILARLDRSGVHEGIIKLMKHRNNATLGASNCKHI